MTLGTKIVVMKDGVIQQVDTPGQLYHYPVNMFVAGFIGTPQMNFLEADCGIRDGKIELITKLGTLVLEKEKRRCPFKRRIHRKESGRRDSSGRYL